MEFRLFRLLTCSDTGEEEVKHTQKCSTCSQASPQPKSGIGRSGEMPARNRLLDMEPSRRRMRCSNSALTTGDVDGPPEVPLEQLLSQVVPRPWQHHPSLVP